MDKLITDAIQAVTKWVGDNPLTILLIGNLIQFLYALTQKTKTKVDDGIISWIGKLYQRITGRKVIQSTEDVKQ
jgi:hypothetical protein